MWLQSLGVRSAKRMETRHRPESKQANHSKDEVEGEWAEQPREQKKGGFHIRRADAEARERKRVSMAREYLDAWLRMYVEKWRLFGQLRILQYIYHTGVAHPGWQSSIHRSISHCLPIHLDTLRGCCCQILQSGFDSCCRRRGNSWF